MKKVLTLTVALLALSASLAMAGAGVNLYQGDCGPTGNTLNGPGTGSQTFTVPNNNLGTDQFVCSVVSPANLTQLVAVETVLDLQTSGSTLPNWFQLGTGCRAGNAAFDFTRAGTNVFTCNSVWKTSAVDPSAPSLITEGVGGANRVRFQAVAAVPAALTLPMDGQEYTVFVLNITQALTRLAGSCTGYNTGACLVCNMLKLDEPAGVGDYTLNHPADGNWVTINSGAPNCPGSTPTQNKTWGAVKAMYR